MNDQRPKLFLVVSVVIFILVVGTFWIVSSKQKAGVKTFPGLAIPTPVSKETNAGPTFSPEKIKIIQEMQTLDVAIESTGFNPSNLTVRLHDQVTWTNKDDKNHKVAGEGWGKIIIGPGEKYTHTFNKPGTYSYSCALQPELKGTIVVTDK